MELEQNIWGLFLLIFWILWTFWFVLCLRLFFNARKSFYIRARAPWLILQSAIGSYLMLTTVAFKAVIGDGFWPSMLELWFSWGMMPLHFIPYPVRALRFILLYQCTLDKGQNGAPVRPIVNWLQKHRKWINDRAALILSWIIIGIVMIVGLYRNITLPENHPNVRAPAFNNPIYYISCGLVTVVIEVFLFAAVYFVAKIGDELKYLFELVAIGSVWFLSVGIFVICGVKKVEPSIINSLLIVILCVASFMISFGMPLHLALVMPKEQNLGIPQMESLEKLLSDPTGEELFLEFLTKRVCTECLTFYKDVKRYRDIDSEDHAQIAAEFRRIKEEYIGEGAPQQVNIPDFQVKAIERCAADPQLNSFDEAFKENEKVLKTDVFLAFKSWGKAREWVARCRRAKDMFNQPAKDERPTA